MRKIRNPVKKRAPYFSEHGIEIYHGDCRDVVRDLPKRSINIVLTDPPYASGARRDAERQVRGSMLRSMKDEDWFSNDAMTTWGLQWFLRSLLVELRDVVTLGAHLYFFTDWRMSPVVYGVMEAHGFRVNHCLVWEKTHFGMGSYWRNQHENIVFASLGKPEAMRDRGRGSVLRFKNVSPKAREHPTQKPTELLSSILSAVPEGSVLDPYTGSGSTLVAAKMEGRKAIGVELDERYCEIAANRLRELDKG